MNLFFRLFLLLLFAAGGSGLGAQTVVTDTTIYSVAQEAPRFPACEDIDTTAAVLSQCADRALLEYVYRRSLYPDAARTAGIQGTVVAQFVVEADGSITQPAIIRDPGGDLGPTVLRTVQNMAQEVRWVPARKDGKPVRYRYTLPIKFRLEEPKPYVMVGRDTVYTDLDTPLKFEGDAAGLEAYVTDKLRYPVSGKDSCLTGRIQVSLLVTPKGRVRVLDIIDFNQLGFDFWYEAIHTAVASRGKWTPGTKDGRPVQTSIDLEMNFNAPGSACATRVKNHAAALELAEAANVLLGEEKTDQAFTALDQALALAPRDGQLLLLRGQLLLDSNRLPEACVDLSLAKEITLVNWYDTVLPLICKGVRLE
ncbi:MAG: TonB family protein [Saprospiraceae bacterium]